jgi:hypothetical protein
MKRKLILAILTISLSGIALPASAKSCDNSKQESSSQSADQQHKKDKKEKKNHTDQQNVVDFSIYG